MKRFYKIIALILTLLLLPACAVNPVTGERELMLISEEQEINMGKQAAPSLNWGFGGKYHDPELEGYLGDIVKRIWANSHRPNFPFKFQVQNSSIPNAFALPGFVAITRGLLVEMENEGQFAAVMGHEVGHVMARHSAKRVSLGILQQIGLVAGSVALEGQKGGDLLLTAGALGSGLLLLKYDRNQEIQSDRLGVLYMSRIGYEPAEALNAHKVLESAVGKFLSRIGKEKKEETFFDELFSTHPRTAVRLEEIQAMIKELPLYTIQGDGRNANKFNAMLKDIRDVNQAYLHYDNAERAFNNDKIYESEESLKKAISMNGKQTPFHNLLGFVRIKQKRYTEAESLFRKALEIDNGYQPAYYGLGVLAYVNNNPKLATLHLKKSIEMFPEHPGSNFFLGLSYYATKNYNGAIKYLSIFSSMAPQHPEVHGYLGMCYERVGDIYSAFNEYSMQVRIAPDSQLGKHARQRLIALSPFIQPPQQPRKK